MDRFLNPGYEAAMKSSMRTKHGAVLIKGGKVLISACNYAEETNSSCSIHAEMNALRQYQIKVSSRYS